MQAVCGDQCVVVSTARRWVRRFKDGELGQADLSDKTGSGRPVTASDQLHQDRFEELIRGNRRIKQKEIPLHYEFIRREWDTLLVFLDSEKFCQMGTQVQ